MIKKSFALCLVICLSLTMMSSIPIFAADGEYEDYETEDFYDTEEIDDSEITDFYIPSLPSVPSTLPSDIEEVVIDEDFQGASALLGLLSDGEYFHANNDGGMNREDFIAILAQLLKWEDGTQSELFLDLDHDERVASYAAYAHDLGYVSVSNGLFRPRDSIKMIEAVKLGVSGAGYQVLAENRGGYPLGYLAVAHEIGLLNKFSQPTQENITYRDCTILFYNMLTCDTLKWVGTGAYDKYEVQKGNTLLGNLHDIYEVSGIVTATTHSALTNSHTQAAERTIEINGTVFNSKENFTSLLGYRIKAFAHGEDAERYTIMTAMPYRNNVTTLRGKDVLSFFVKEDKIQYQKQGAVEYHQLDSKYNLIYNGRSHPQHGGVYFASQTAEFTLIDNNKDGNFDVVLVLDAKYMKIGQINDLSKSIVDIGGNSPPIDLTVRELKIETFDGNGNPMLWFKLKENSIVAAAVSIDGTLVSIRELAGFASGSVVSMNTTDNTVQLENGLYTLSDYCLENAPPIQVGNDYFLYLDGEFVVLAEFKSYADYYGYLIRSEKTSGLEGKYCSQILTQTGDVEILMVAKKVSLNDDGIIETTHEKVQTVLGERQLIQYRLNAQGEISTIYTARDAGEHPFADTQNAHPLKIFNTPNPKYKSSTRNFFPYANIVGTMFFVVPYSDSLAYNKENYGVRLYNELGLTNNRIYNTENNGVVELYNIGLNGSCPIAVFKHDTLIESITDTSEVGLVESVSEVIGGYKKLYLLTSGRYAAYQILDKSFSQIEQEEVHPGDIIRFSLNINGEIDRMTVDYDARAMRVSESANHNTFDANNFLYITGRVYSLTNGYMYLSPSATPNAVNDYSWSAMKLVRQTGNIVIYNRATHTASLGSAADIEQAKNGQEGSFIVARANQYMDSTFIVVYR